MGSPVTLWPLSVTIFLEQLRAGGVRSTIIAAVNKKTGFVWSIFVMDVLPEKACRPCWCFKFTRSLYIEHVVSCKQLLVLVRWLFSVIPALRRCESQNEIR